MTLSKTYDPHSFESEIYKRWEEKGGIGIRYQANEDDLEEYLFAKLEAIIEKKPLDF